MRRSIERKYIHNSRGFGFLELLAFWESNIIVIVVGRGVGYSFWIHDCRFERVFLLFGFGFWFLVLFWH